MKKFARIIGIFMLVLAFGVPAGYWLWMLEVRIAESHDLNYVKSKLQQAVQEVGSENKSAVVIGLTNTAARSQTGYPKYQLADVTTGKTVDLPKDILLQKTVNSRAVHFVVYRPSRFRNFSERDYNQQKSRFTERVGKLLQKLVVLKPQKVPIGGVIIENGSVNNYSYPLHRIVTQSYYVSGEYPEVVAVIPWIVPYIDRIKLKTSEYVISPFNLGGTIDWVTNGNERVLISSQGKYFALERRTGTTNTCSNLGKLLPGMSEPPAVLETTSNTNEQLFIVNTLHKDKSNRLVAGAKGLVYDIQGDNGSTTTINWPGRLYVLGQSRITGSVFAIGNLSVEERLKTKRIAPANYLLEINTSEMTLSKIAPLPINLEYDPSSVFIEKTQTLVTPAANGAKLRVIVLPKFELQKTAVSIPEGFKIQEIARLN